MGVPSRGKIYLNMKEYNSLKIRPPIFLSKTKYRQYTKRWQIWEPTFRSKA